jgi:hypothetical protein
VAVLVAEIKKESHMLKRLLIAGVMTSATLVSVPAAAHHSNLGERIAAEIILHSVFGDRHGHSVQIYDSRNHGHNNHRGDRYRESARVERLRRELAQARRAYRREQARAERREWRRDSRRTARYDNRRDDRRQSRRHEREQNRELAALRVRDAQLSAQLAALVAEESEAPRGRTGPRGGRNK